MAPIAAGGHSVARMDDLECPTYTREANAALILAAPEMLAALQEVMGWIHAWDPNFVQDDDWAATRALAGAAIAKATGTTP